MQTLFNRSINTLNDVARRVPDFNIYRRLLFPVLGAQCVPSGVRCIAPLQLYLAFLLTALLLEAFQAIAQVVGQHRAKRRIFRHEQLGAVGIEI